MKTRNSIALFALGVGLACPLPAATVNVEFGGSNFTGQGVITTTGTTWNGGLTSNGTASALNNSQGNPTGVGYTIGGLAGVGTANEGSEFGTNTVNLLTDYVYGADGNPASHIDLLITGLTPGGAYNVALYGMQNQTFGGFLADNRGSTFTIGGVSQTSTGTNTGLSDAYVAGQTHVIFASITANGSGQIDVDIDPYTSVADAAFPTAFLNGFQVESVPGSTPDLSVPATVSDTTNGDNVYMTVTVSNEGATARNVTGMSFAETDSGFSDDANTFPLEIPAGGSADVYVLFEPVTGGLAEDTLTLVTNDPQAPTLDVLLSVEVHDPEIVIASSYGFGSFPFIPGPIARDISVENLGLSHDLTLTDNGITGDGAAAYSVTSLPGPITESGVIEVTFNPAAVGVYPAVLSLETNDPFNPTVTITLSGSVAGGGTPVLQWGFDAASGPVAVPVIDDSGTILHNGTNLLYGEPPVYSADIPVASMTQNVTGTGSVDFTGTRATISTANSDGVFSGQGIFTATDVFNAGGLTMEVWVKNPSSTNDIGQALGIGGMYVLGEQGGRIGFILGDVSTVTTWTTDAFVAGEWNHLAVVMTTTDPTAKAYSNISAYLNGVLIASGAHTFPWFLDRASAVGNHQSFDASDFEGLVYEPRISLGTMGISELTVVPGLQTMAAVTGQSDGEATSLPVTIANTNNVAYQVTGVSYSGADSADFSGLPTLPLVIPAGGSSEFMVGFDPSHGGGTYTAILTLTTDDPNRPTIEVVLTVEVAGADANLILVTETSLVSPTRMRIDFEGQANTAYQVKSSADLQEAIFTGAVTVAVDGLTTDDIGGGRGTGYVEFDIIVPGRMFYQIQTTP